LELKHVQAHNHHDRTRLTCPHCAQVSVPLPECVVNDALIKALVACWQH